MSSWDRFTLKEEYEDGLRDQFDRYRFFLSSNRDVLYPSISEQIFEQGFRAEYPGGKSFAVCLSHDMDFLPLTTFARLKDSLYSGLKGLRSNLSNLIAYNVDRHFDIEFIIEMEKRIGAKSSFYFLSLDRSDTDFAYRVDSLKREFALLEREGFEIGLHGGHDAYLDSARIALEKERLEGVLGKKIAGYRGHYLKIVTPKTWKYLAENRFEYDTTLSYPNCAGFRNGMCYPFRPYSLESESFIDIVEVPLVVMDASLFGYMRLTPETAYELCVDLIEKVEKIGGVFTLLWHNSGMKRERLQLFRRLLAFLNTKNAWFASTSEVVRHWTEKGLIEKVEEILLREKPVT